ncbi:MAG: DNA alkylation repair protein [Phycisphaeraceae bacterium]|nr:DNA alkylation repair protein [Phycisphaeraceae bacterium]MCB9848750.1 DNA alkylation repair protein [Phycisphaeraceae bacterium]
MTPPAAVAKRPAPKTPTAEQVMKQLRAMGTAQNRKVYARHGAPENMLGVSYADFGKLKKQIKTDHNLAKQLWDTGIMDAQILAAMVCDPAQLTKSECDAWVKDATCYQVANELAGAVARSPYAISRYEKWRKSKPEFTQAAAWATLAGVFKHAPDAVSDAIGREAITRIETTIHTAPNRAREAMNTCLIAIGTYREPLRAAAIAAAIRIGKVEVDHGDTSCKTPDAASYIEKSAAHLARKKGK